MMNYNNGKDALSSSNLNEFISLNVSTSNKIFNGTMKNVIHHNSTCQQSVNNLDKEVQLQADILEEVDECYELGFNNKKLKFSEKLKVLLKHCGNKSEIVDLNDPYVFSEVDTQYGIPHDQALTDVNSYVHNSSLPSIKSNVLGPKSIIFPKSVVPKIVANSVGGKDSSETKNSYYKNMKLAKLTVPLYSQNNSLVANINQNSYKTSGISNPEKLIISNSKNSSGIAPQLSASTRNYVEKSKHVQNFKPSMQINNTVNLKRNIVGKPNNIEQSQLFRYSGVKGERRADNKSKSFAKGKSLLNQLQKTVSFNRSLAKPRKLPSKSVLPTSGKNSSVHPELPFSSNISNKNVNKRSLLEESLLGIKTSSCKKEPTNFTTLKERNIVSNPVKYNHSKVPIETGTGALIMPRKLQLEQLGLGKKESLQRIWNIRNKLNILKQDHHHFGPTINDVDYEETSNSESLLFQNYWFSLSNDVDSLSYNDRRRDTKLSQLKVELRHKIKQLQWKYRDEYRDKVVEVLLESARKQPNLTAFLLRLENSRYGGRRKFLRSRCSAFVRPVFCNYINEIGQQCVEEAMPCVKYCQKHIACSDDQLLFSACTAIRSDNTACCAPVLDHSAEKPLCLKHKRLEFMSEKPKRLLNVKSKPVNKITQSRKRSRSSIGGSGRSGRNRKRKRPHPKDKRDEVEDRFIIANNLSDSLQKYKLEKRNIESNDMLGRRNALMEINPQVVTKSDVDESQEVEVGEEVLAIAADLPLELANHATRLLEEHDFTNVLNHIPADAFNDLFTEDKEEYEPTPQETEELERALEAVDNDVKSLEKLSQTQGILDALLDEQTIAQTLAQLPEVTANLEVPPTLVPVFYQNGFTNLNQIEQTLNDVNKSLTQTVLLNQGTDVINNHFTNNLTVPNHADMLQS